MSIRRFFKLALARKQGRILHFLHIGKTGGTAVITTLQPHARDMAYVVRFHGHDKQLQDIPAGERVVFFLRDPLTRFVSGFNSRLRQGQPRNFYPWSPREKVIFERFPSPNHLALALESADAGEHAAAAQAMHEVFHLRPFCRQWFGSEAALLARRKDIFFIGFQETLAADFDRLKARLGLPADIPLPTDEVAAHRTPEHFDKKLEPQARENLQRWYAEDIHCYQVCREIAAEMPAA